jgi:hypothetical protein
MDCGERVIFPKVRDAAPDTILLADGFSCRTQIEQGTGRRSAHIAQVIRDALPIHDEDDDMRPRARIPATAAAFGAAAVLVAGVAGRRRLRTQ